jgi:hypothetical protein
MQAYVADARRDLSSRNVLRTELADAVLMTARKNHFLCAFRFLLLFNYKKFSVSVESTGALASADLVNDACMVMECKCVGFAEEIAKLPTV